MSEFSEDMVQDLREVQEKYKNDFVSTGRVSISRLARDCAYEIESLRAQLAESRAREQAAVKERDEIQELFRGDCDKCKHFDAPCGSRRPDGRVVGFCGQLKPDCWKWRGPQDAKGEAR